MLCAMQSSQSSSMFSDSMCIYSYTDTHTYIYTRAYIFYHVGFLLLIAILIIRMKTGFLIYITFPASSQTNKLYV